MILESGAEMRITGTVRDIAVVCVNGGQAGEVPGTWSASLEWLLGRFFRRNRGGVVCFCHRLGDSRLDCIARRPLWGYGLAAQLWPREPRRRHDLELVDG